MKITAYFTLLLALGAAAGLAREGKTILLIGHKPDHPPRCHEYLSTCELLAKCLRQTKGIEAVVSNGWPTDAKLLERTDAIVLYTSPGAEIVLAEKSAAAFEAMMKRGVGLVAIHWATGVHKKNVGRLGKRWYASLGGGWPHFAGITMGKSPLVQKDPAHPVCRGWKRYEISDEFYFSPVIHEKGKVLLEVTARGKPLPVGWTIERADGGRAFGTTLGHFHRNFGLVPFRRMLINGIIWSAGLEVPAKGAPCKLDKDDPLFPKS